MKVRIKGVYPKRKRLADGREVTYWYHRKTGARLPDDPESPAFLERVLELDSGKPARQGKPRHDLHGAREKPAPNDGADAQPEPPVDGKVVPSRAPAAVPSPRSSIPDRCFKALVTRYRISTAFLDLAASTRAEYERHMRYVEPAIGLRAVAAFTADHMDQIMSKYPDNPALRQAIRRTMSVLLSYAARTLKWIPSNPLLRTDKPRKRQEEGQKPFTEPEIARYRRTHAYGTRERLTFEIGLSTAFRREDIAGVKGEDIVVLPSPVNLLNFDTTNTDAGAGPFEILEARKAVEASAAAIAATRATSYDFMQLDESIATMQDGALIVDGKDQTDREFHRTIAGMTGNAVIISMVDALWTQQESSRMWKAIHQRVYMADVQPTWVGQHYGIVAALKARNPDAAYKAMWHHLSSVAKELLEAGNREGETDG